MRKIRRSLCAVCSLAVLLFTVYLVIGSFDDSSTVSADDSFDPFYTEDNITYQIFPGRGTATVWKIEAGITDVVIPDTVTSELYEVTEMDKQCIVSPLDLRSIVLPIGLKPFLVGSSGTIFKECENLLSIEVREGNPFLLSRDGVLFYQTNGNMTHLVQFPLGMDGAYIVPNGVHIIEDYAFNGAKRLSFLSIPESVMSMGWSAIKNTNLKAIIAPSGVCYDSHVHDSEVCVLLYYSIDDLYINKGHLDIFIVNENMGTVEVSLKSDLFFIEDIRVLDRVGYPAGTVQHDGQNYLITPESQMVYVEINGSKGKIVSLDSINGFEIISQTPLLVKSGGLFIFTVDVSRGYDISDVVVSANGQQISPVNGKYTVNNISTDVKISVSYPTLTINKGSGQGHIYYSINGNDKVEYRAPITVFKGSSLEIFSVPAKGYEVRNITGGIDQTVTTIDSVSDNVKIDVNFILLPAKSGGTLNELPNDNDWIKIAIIVACVILIIIFGCVAYIVHSDGDTPVVSSIIVIICTAALIFTCFNFGGESEDPGTMYKIDEDSYFVVWGDLNSDLSVEEQYGGIYVSVDSDRGGMQDQYVWTVFDVDHSKYTGTADFKLYEGETEKTTEPGKFIPSNGGTYRVSVKAYSADKESFTLSGKVKYVSTITKTYNWVYSGVQYSLSISFSYEEFCIYHNANTNRSPSSSDYVKFVTYSDPVVREISTKLRETYNPSYIKGNPGYANFILSFVQICFYYPPHTEDLRTMGPDMWLYGSKNYAASPLETIYYGMGDCEDTAILAAALFTASGVDSALIYLSSEEMGHIMTGVALNNYTPPNFNSNYYEIIYQEINGKYYYACESTTDSFLSAGISYKDILRSDEPASYYLAKGNARNGFYLV